jgi:hypothetical protein
MVSRPGRLASLDFTRVQLYHRKEDVRSRHVLRQFCCFQMLHSTVAAGFCTLMDAHSVVSHQPAALKLVDRPKTDEKAHWANSGKQYDSDRCGLLL